MGNINQERCQEQDRVITVAKRDTSLASAHNHVTRTPARARAAERARPRLATTVVKKDTSLASAHNHATRAAARAAAAVLTTAHATTAVNSATSHVTAPHKRSQPVSALPSSVEIANTETYASSRTSQRSKHQSYSTRLDKSGPDQLLGATIEVQKACFCISSELKHPIVPDASLPHEEAVSVALALAVTMTSPSTARLLSLQVVIANLQIAFTQLSLHP